MTKLRDETEKSDFELLRDFIKENSSGNEQNQLVSILQKYEEKTTDAPKREPLTSEIYTLLIETTRRKRSSYASMRLRIAFCLLTLTGIRINKLLGLKVYQLRTLRKDYWISITRSESRVGRNKAFLNLEGKKLIDDRKKDFDTLFKAKESGSYIFTSRSNHDKMLNCETITRDINGAMRSVSASLPHKPYLSSYSFRIGYILELWQDNKDIPSIRESICSKENNPISP